jgi:hypothetical protein
MSKISFAKLITEAESLCFIEGEVSQAEIKRRFLDANLNALYKKLAQDIYNAKLTKPHHYRFHIQVHAQEVSDE